MKRKLLEPEARKVIIETQKRIIASIEDLKHQLICVDCGSTNRLNYHNEDGVKICYACYSREWQRNKRAKHKAG
jgi:hypothetical protein